MKLTLLFLLYFLTSYFFSLYFFFLFSIYFTQVIQLSAGMCVAFEVRAENAVAVFALIAIVRI